MASSSDENASSGSFAPRAAIFASSSDSLCAGSVLYAYSIAQ